VPGAVASAIATGAHQSRRRRTRAIPAMGVRAEAPAPPVCGQWTLFCSSRGKSFPYGAHQQAAVDHLVCRFDGRCGGSRPGLRHLARRRHHSMATLISTAGNLGGKCACGLRDFAPYRQHAEGAHHGQNPLHGCPRANREPAERVATVRDRGAGRCLCRDLAHGPARLALEAMTSRPSRPVDRLLTVERGSDAS
jgi:hypothetical protein